MDFDSNGSKSRTIDFLSACSGSSNFSLPWNVEANTTLKALFLVQYVDPLDDIFNSDSAWSHVNELSECEASFIAFKNMLFNIYFYKTVLANINMQEIVQNVFRFRTYNYSGNVDHIKCSLLEMEVQSHIGDLKERMILAREIIMNMTETSTPSEALYYAQQLFGYYEDLFVAGYLRLNYSSRLSNDCQWLRNLALEENREAESYLMDIKETETTTEEVVSAYHNVKATFNAIFETHETVISNTIANVRKYLNGNLAKRHLGQIIGDLRFTKGNGKYVRLWF